MKKRVGIESINLYGCSLILEQCELAVARGKDPDEVVSDYLINTRSLNPVWEDTLTMACNAAKPLITPQLKDEIGLLVFGTEGSFDFGKPLSTNLHGILELNPNVRNYEVKHACFCGTAAMSAAIDWVASGNNRGRKALVVAADYSRQHFNTKQEFVMGGIGAAIVISDTPRILEFEMAKRGNWTTNIYDTYRPTATKEMGNNEVSLYTYLDALEGSWKDYVNSVPEGVDFLNDFKKFVFHTPFAGMAFQAFRTLSNTVMKRNKAEIRKDFEERVFPALRYSRRVGSCYGASNFAGLSSLIVGCDDLNPGDRIGLYSYGSGAAGEFYSGIVCPEAKEDLRALSIDAAFDRRRSVSIEEYEEIETKREEYIDNPDFTPDTSSPAGHYKEFYEGKGLCVLKSVKDYQRDYGWS